MNRNPLYGEKLKNLDEERAKLHKKSGKFLPIAILLPILFTFFSFSIAPPGLAMFFGFIAFSVAMFAYSNIINSPFNELKYNVRQYLLSEFMKIYHPNIDYRFQPKKDQVKQIIKSSKLVTCNVYKEEDVISGTANNINFYLSEIILQTTTGKSTSTNFKGMLFKIKIPGRNFPPAQIQSKLGLLKKMFSNFREKKSFGFWYDTHENDNFIKELGPFFPFIRHLIQQQKDIRIQTQGNEITILMNSDMKFLDDPQPSLSRSFKDEAYYKKIGQQINSLLFIVETFAGKLDKEEVIERLELKEIEYRQLGLDDEYLER